MRWNLSHPRDRERCRAVAQSLTDIQAQDRTAGERDAQARTGVHVPGDSLFTPAIGTRRVDEYGWRDPNDLQQRTQPAPGFEIRVGYAAAEYVAGDATVVQQWVRAQQWAPGVPGACPGPQREWSSIGGKVHTGVGEDHRAFMTRMRSPRRRRASCPRAEAPEQCR